jgi:poly(3-hydroxybutyrate) depolymerase
VYSAYGLSRSFVRPLNLWGTAIRELWTLDGFPLSHTPFARAVAAGGELLERATRHFDKPRFGLAATPIAAEGRTVAVREERVLSTPFCDLIHFARETERQDPKVLLVAPLSGHHATLLRDTVRQLLPEHDVYVTDWLDARLVPLASGGFDLDDYIALLQAFLRKLGPGVHAVGVCQPGVPLLAAAALLAEDDDVAVPHSLTLIAAPIDPRVRETQVGRLARSRPIGWFERVLVQRVPMTEPGAGRLVYPGYLQLAAFMSMNPANHARSHLRFYRDLVDGDAAGAQAHRGFYDEYLSVMDVPAEYYLQTVVTVFQKYHLAKGEMRWRGRLVRPEALRHTSLFTIEGESDDITAEGQTAAAHALCANIPRERRLHHLEQDAGHFGTFSGRRFREHVYPKLRQFIRDAAAFGAPD